MFHVMLQKCKHVYGWLRPYNKVDIDAQCFKLEELFVLIIPSLNGGVNGSIIVSFVLL